MLYEQDEFIKKMELMLNNFLKALIILNSRTLNLKIDYSRIFSNAQNAENMLTNQQIVTLTFSTILHIFNEVWYP